ncbi:putative monooxygenase [Microthyrium microscopicum]|uniref:Putative monooxygenase n=1 Tax=Microthyrium microscopicum TaxID=703497 RepID=A0A6A6U3W2_9PEZI|nr:putative monooxygenase [Microthyrium microscopicum]
MASEIHSLKIAIIGAGMGGLTTALALAKAGFQNIEVYEAASNLGFVGAGIQMAPNMAKVLDHLGVWQDIVKDGVVIKETSIRKGSTNEELGHVSLEHIESAFNYPHMVGHRTHLANGIYNGCKNEKAIKVFFSTALDSVQSFGPKPSFIVIPRDTKVPVKVEADILLAADGIKSNVRLDMLHELKADAEVEDSGQAAYRVLLKREDLQKDPELLELLDSNQVTRWIGSRRHIIAYPVAGKTIYNISTAQPDDNFAAAPSATYTTKGSKPAMLSVFEDFCPLAQRMLNLVPDGEVCEWKLRVHAPLPTWIHGSVALLGDACHPTLPHLNQGAAQAIEDAAVLGVVLARLPDAKPESINKALRVYEGVRKERAEKLVAMAAANGKAMQLSSGAEQEERDKQFAALKAGKGPVPDKWADGDVQKMIFGFDCVKVAEDTFQQSFDAM